MPTHSILTMSRGDEYRIADWMKYHFTIGFTEFNLILDNPIDRTEQVARRVAEEWGMTLRVDTIGPDGEYYDGLANEERWNRVQQWRRENLDVIARLGLPIVDPLSMRQYKHFPAALKRFQTRGPECWLALIDVDEYIAIPGTKDIASLTQGATSPRLRLLNFNFNTEGWNTQSNVREFTRRWARDDIEAFGNGWENRVKTIARCDRLVPLVSVHAITLGSFQIVPPTVARLHHYKYPEQGVNIPYAIHDETIAPNRFRLDQ
ncbi:glycosyltransferase family 2 protein [Brevibacterium aurantiacum]|uniref:glycosyltransferase family 2 protein n=1 Tax=Brevibacterium aurantiacum TaxID=273384 RepID=UPI0015E0B0DE|nr:glycosyltransferase family 2 protein [Brevibacterium aurantiacum]